MSALICASLVFVCGRRFRGRQRCHHRGWKPIFNGKDLSGWSVHYASKTSADAPPASSFFAVKNGEIHVYPTQKAGSDQPNAYIVTDADYKDYRAQPRIQMGREEICAARSTTCATRACSITCIATSPPTGRRASSRRSRKATRAIRGRCPRRCRRSSIRKRVAMRCPRTAACRSPWARTATSCARATAA